MRVPSGENAGSVSIPVPLVRRTASPPSRGDTPQVARVGEDDVGLAQGGLLQQQRFVRRGADGRQSARKASKRRIGPPLSGGEFRIHEEGGFRPMLETEI